MANYYASGRSNYFRVKDVEAFKNEVKVIGSLEVYEKDGFISLLSNNEGGFPNDHFDEYADDYLEIDWDAIFAKHLADEEVAIIMEAGSEKLRYINGYAVAYNNKGESRIVTLNSIYDLAKELGSNITRAEY